MNDRLEQLYQQTILEHNKNPRNYKKPDKFTHHSHGKNPLCGDDYEIFLDIQGDVIKDVGFQGTGCAISKSSGSILTTTIIGKTVDEVMAMKDEFIALVTKSCPGDCAHCPSKLKVFEGVKKYPIRVKCATLIWRALEDAILNKEKDSAQVSTE